jgi:hypothetical protein
MDRVFRSADDDTLIGLVKSARGRLVIIAPALTKSVAKAVADRMADLGTLSMTVILDADPEVYRLGYGDVEALDIIRKASIDAQFDLREQQGIRIAIVMSDDQTLIYSPVPRNIEASSKTDEKPNAVFLTNKTGQTEFGVSSSTEGRRAGRTCFLQHRLHARPGGSLKPENHVTAVAICSFLRFTSSVKLSR